MNESASNSVTDAVLTELTKQNAALREDVANLRRQLVEQEQGLHLRNLVLDRVRESAYLSDEDGRLVYVNEESCRSLGYSAAELLQLQITDIDPDWTTEREPHPLDERSETAILLFEARHRRKDGSLIPVEVSTSHVEFSGKDYCLSLVRDIGAESRSEALLTEQMELEEKFRRLAENTLHIICRYDRQCRLVYANSGLSAALRKHLQDLIGKKPTEHTSDPQYVQYQASIAAVIDSGIECDFDMIVSEGDSEPRHHHIRIVPERGLNGEIVGALALGLDITERREAEQRLHASEQAFRAVVEHSPDYIARYDLSYRRVYANPALLKLMGRRASEVLGTMPTELSSFVDTQQYMDQLQRVAETGSEVTGEVLLHDVSGRVRWGHMRIVPEFAPDGKVTSMLAISRDIDELKRSEQLFRTLTENFPDPIIRYDRNCLRTYVNPEFERVSGVTAAKLLGKAAGRIAGATPEVARRFRAKLKKIMASGVEAKFELAWTNDGKAQCWYVHAVPEADAHGTVQSALTVWRDISERKEAEQRLRESYELLRELASQRETAREEERKRIARELHDELGQQLTALRMGTSTLRIRFGHDNPELAAHVQKILTLADKTMQVVRDVVTSLRPAVLDAGIVAALEWLAAEFSRNGKRTCWLRVPEEHVAIAEDRAIALFRIVQEALTNVARHAQAKQVFITLEQKGFDCQLEVRDDGNGFDPLTIGKQSFGLVGMKERVLMLGGEIIISSTPGNGTSIRVRVPLVGGIGPREAGHDSSRDAFAAG
ncbi:PAS domain-containing sensor histidine kinase [Paraburkholderia phenazinium]|uniref:PAS domain S-box-containing protein n=1 Tax=Paraburkholderia phenazinium TaxID=60549 RepID=A0A1G7RYM1_9BURK|nr:PAS domain S-box protein [Paraburkholderia phenazinium]SDG15865.1 PAS domain S-box-containing protein [Paraburkholderia phenazinium]